MNELLTRRFFILVPLALLLKMFLKPQKVYASSKKIEENWNLSKDEWKKRLSPESYYVLRRGNRKTFY